MGRKGRVVGTERRPGRGWSDCGRPDRGCRGVSTKPCFPSKMGAMAIRLATWNVNSLRQRLDHLARFAAEAEPDVICLQETKVTDELFPRAAVRAMGYPHLLVHGQKGYGGVAILSRLPFEAEGTKVWCGKDDQRHYNCTIEQRFKTTSGCIGMLEGVISRKSQTFLSSVSRTRRAKCDFRYLEQ